MAERARIATYFAALTSGEPGSFSLSDDAAVVTTPSGKHLVVTTDSVIEGIHMLRGAGPQQFATKLMRRNLSDLAAMGATPWRYTLNLHTPRALSEEWFAEFAAALAREQEQFGLTLIGGDSTSGGDHIHLTMTCFGLLSGPALRRNSARVGDEVYVSGTLGGAAYALDLLQRNQPVDDALAVLYAAPEPRLALGQALLGIATSAIDISDGLIADAAQIAAASHVGLRIQRTALPLHPALQKEKLNVALAGDDYELLFTAPTSARSAMVDMAQQLRLPVTRIGEVVAGTRVQLIGADGREITVGGSGYEHA